MIFTSKGKSYNKNISNIHIDGNKIQQVNKTKFIGIIIEEHRNWATHINHLCNIIARNVGILQKLRYFIPAYVMKILYHSLILSLLNKNTRTRVETQMIGTKKNTFQIELKNRFTALEEHDEMDSLNKNMTEMIQQSALSIAKQTKKQKNPKISSPTRALMKKRREMIENETPRDHLEYVEICKTIKKKAKEDIRKHNLDKIRETIEASKSLKKVRTHSLGKNRVITLLD